MPFPRSGNTCFFFCLFVFLFGWLLLLSSGKRFSLKPYLNSYPKLASTDFHKWITDLRNDNLRSQTRLKLAKRPVTEIELLLVMHQMRQTCRKPIEVENPGDTVNPSSTGKGMFRWVVSKTRTPASWLRLGMYSIWFINKSSVRPARK